MTRVAAAAAEECQREARAQIFLRLFLHRVGSGVQCGVDSAPYFVAAGFGAGGAGGAANSRM